SRRRSRLTREPASAGSRKRRSSRCPNTQAGRTTTSGVHSSRAAIAHSGAAAPSRFRRVGKGARRTTLNGWCKNEARAVPTLSAGHGGHGAQTRLCPPYASIRAICSSHNLRRLPLHCALLVIAVLVILQRDCGRLERVRSIRIFH